MVGVVVGKHNILKTNQHVFNEFLYVATTKQYVVQEGANKIQ
jgi:hypothetical protein